MSMSASDAGPVSRLGETFFDVRGSSRSLRLTWHGTSGVAVISIWQGGTCTGTFRVAAEDLSRLVDALRRGVPGGQANEATGPLALDGQPSGSAATPAEPFTGAMIALPDVPPGGGGRHMGRPTSGFPLPAGYGGYPGGPDYGATQRYGAEQPASGSYGADPDPGAGRHAAGPGANGQYGGQRPSYQDHALGAYGYQPSPPGRPRELMPLESQSLRSLARARAARAPQQQPGPGSYTGPQPVPGTGSYTGPQAFSGAPSGGPADPGTGPMELADWYPQARGDQSGYPQPAPPLAPEAEQPPAGSSVPYWNVAGNGAGDAPGQPGSSWYTAGYQPEQDTSGAYAAGTSAYPAYSPPGYAASPQSPAASGSGAYPQPGYAAYAPPAAYGADAYNASYNASAPGAADVRPSPAPGPAANGTGGYPAQPGYPVPPSYPPAYPADGAPYQGQPGGYPGQTAGSGAFPAPGGGAPWGGDANGYQTGNGYAYPNGQGHVNGYAASGHEGYSAGQPAGPLGEGTSAQPQAEGQQGYWEHGQQSPGNWS